MDQSRLQHECLKKLEVFWESQLPRSENQVSNVKRQLQFSGKDGGSYELFVMMRKATTEDRNTNATPDPAIIACTDWQLDNLVRFCAPPVNGNHESDVLSWMHADNFL